MNVFATTSWKLRVGTTLPKVIENILGQTIVPDLIRIYLSLEEFPLKEDSLPKEILDITKKSSRVEFRWSEGNLKSFKRLLSIKDNPNCNLVIYDDDTLHHPAWFANCISQLNLDPSVVYAGWIALSCEDYSLENLYRFSSDERKANYYNTSNGFIINTNLYKDVDLDLQLPVDLGINDDDYYLNIINTINGIKVRKFVDARPSTLLKSVTDMRVNGYSHKAVLLHLRENEPEKYNTYMKIKHEAVKGLTVLTKQQLR